MKEVDNIIIEEGKQVLLLYLQDHHHYEYNPTKWSDLLVEVQDTSYIYYGVLKEALYELEREGKVNWRKSRGKKTKWVWLVEETSRERVLRLIK